LLINLLPGDEMVQDRLEECQKQMDAISAEGRYSFSTYMNPEGKEGFPKVYSQAAEDKPDFYLWMSGDLELVEGAFASFLENSEFLRHKAIIAGSVCNHGRSLLFGGRSRRGKLIEPDPIIPVPCHLYDMDLLLVPESAMEMLESPSDIFRQGYFDYGIGEKAAKAGVVRVIAPGIMAQTGREVVVPLWQDQSKSLETRWGSMAKTIGKELLRVVRSFFR